MEWLLKIVMYFISGSGFIICIEFEIKFEEVDSECEFDYDLEDGIIGVKVEWYDKVKKKNSKGIELVGKVDNVKMLKWIYVIK